MKHHLVALCAAAILAACTPTGDAGSNANAPDTTTPEMADRDGVTLSATLQMSEQVIAGTAISGLLLIEPVDPGEQLVEVAINSTADGLDVQVDELVTIPPPSDVDTSPDTETGEGSNTIRVPVTLSAPPDTDASEINVTLGVTGCLTAGCAAEAGTSASVEHTVQIRIPTAEKVPTQLATPLAEDIDADRPFPVVRNEVLILVEQDADLSAQERTVTDLAQQIDGVVVGGHTEAGVYQLRVEVDDTEQLLDLVETLEENRPDGVAATMINTAATSATTSVTPERSTGWADWDAPTDGENWQWSAIDMPAAWAVTTGSADVVMSVLDTGINPQHPDLRSNLANGYVYDLTTPSDSNHGSHVSSLACGSDSQTFGRVVGAMWECSLRFFEINTDPFFDEQRSESEPAWAVWNHNQTAGMSLAARRGSDVVNVSWAYQPDCEIEPHDEDTSDIRFQRLARPGMEEIIAGTPEIFWVFAAGNACRDAGRDAAAGLSLELSNMIVVAATNSDDTLAPFSNFGPSVTLAAPGGSLMNADGTLRGSGHGILGAGTRSTHGFATWLSMSGTSQAAPIVAGVAGLMRTVNPTLPAADIRACLELTARDSGRSVMRFTDEMFTHARDTTEAQTITDRVTDTDLVGLFVVNPTGALECAQDPEAMLRPVPAYMTATPGFEDVSREFVNQWYTHSPDMLESDRAETLLKPLVTDEFWDMVRRYHDLRDDAWANRYTTTVDIEWEHFGEDQLLGPEMYAVYGFVLSDDFELEAAQPDRRTVTVYMEFTDDEWRVAGMDPPPLTQ